MISYSLHLSNKKHALTTTKKVAAASKHNLRQYESKDYCKDNIHVLTGGDNILDDLKEAYHQEFDACLDEYNQGKRSDRQIDDYLKYVSESGKNDVAAELIIQLGDAEFWHDKPPDMWRKMIPIFEEQIKYLGEMVPDFRIVSAVVHLDEKSPHAHIVNRNFSYIFFLYFQANKKRYSINYSDAFYVRLFYSVPSVIIF